MGKPGLSLNDSSIITLKKCLLGEGLQGQEGGGQPMENLCLLRCHTLSSSSPFTEKPSRFPGVRLSRVVNGKAWTLWTCPGGCIVSGVMDSLQDFLSIQPGIVIQKPEI